MAGWPGWRAPRGVSVVGGGPGKLRDATCFPTLKFKNDRQSRLAKADSGSRTAARQIEHSPELDEGGSR